ncbi:TetR/AcrR family transcriptional regulator [Paenibacillus sp. JNUCC31]|uniref:TetR/AcrR family transcriptional regulator n=1 Tax=Paenibacillus sp. JNUCC-31 TaxID=2777983 RepID=UPI00177C5103|nr:TetR/AcrR family transcriptional regulator [Paenibacillus sp. JNUCC-31]QOS78684.1 TetR/AcrR family transcriptional regulator [Paenibacillus sp. JNUCC-31]
MVRQREFDTDKVLDAAMQIFWDKGFEATSLSDLTTAMGIQRPSLYAAFGDKKELFETALRRYTTLHAAQIRSRLQHTSSVREAFRALFEHIGAEGDVTQPRHGCFCINTMVELAPHDPKFAVLTREHQMYLAAIFQETIERGQESGELHVDLHANALANSLVVSMVGLTVMMKSEPDRSFVHHSIEVALSLLGH